VREISSKRKGKRKEVNALTDATSSAEFDDLMYGVAKFLFLRHIIRNERA
jgi:hypothetical protein